MADGIVGWRFFDAESGVVPEDLSPSIFPGGGAGRIVVLASTPLARSAGWANRAVLALAREWARGDLRIFLMDLGLDSPSLHEELGVQNMEGVSDAFLYGASVQRIAQPALDDTIFFAAAGTATTDPEQILAHPRWSDLAGGFSEADATLLLFLPTGLPGADKILARATDVLFLAGEGESAETHLGAAAAKVAAMCGPLGAAGESPAESGEIPAREEKTDEAGDPEGTGVEDLIGTFGLAEDLPMGDDVEAGASALGGPQGLRLAEEFAEVVADAEDPVPEEGWPTSDGAPADEGTSDFALSDEFVLETSGGEIISETSESETEDEGIPAQEIPDFGAEFAQMPGLEQDLDSSDAPVPSEPDPMPDGGLLEDPGMGLMPPMEEEEKTESQGTQGREGPERKDRGEGRRYASDRLRPLSSRRPPPKKKVSLGALAGVVFILVVLASGVGTAMGAFSVPGFGWLEGMFGEVPLAALERTGPVPTDPVLRFSLELLTYGEAEREIALEMRNTLRGRRPDLIFNLAPEESGGTVRYVLYAGPAADVVEAENLRVPIAELFREDPESWPIRVTPRAFLLGSAGSLQDAQRILLGYETSGVLGYILQVSYPDGSVGYEILSGAYQNTDDGRWWQLSLREYGLRDLPLVDRRGKPPE